MMAIVNTSLKQNSSSLYLTKHLSQISQELLEVTKIDELKNILITEFTQGLPSDMEFNAY